MMLVPLRRSFPLSPAPQHPRLTFFLHNGHPGTDERPEGLRGVALGGADAAVVELLAEEGGAEVRRDRRGGGQGEVVVVHHPGEGEKGFTIAFQLEEKKVIMIRIKCFSGSTTYIGCCGLLFISQSRSSSAEKAFL